LGENGELVRRAKDGDERAIARLIAIYKGLVYTIALRMLGDPDWAEDITQETFIRAFLRIKTLKHPERFRSWITMIVRNLIYDHLRKRKTELPPPVRTGPGVESVRKKVIIQQALLRLSKQDRLLLTLFYYQGFTMKEIGEVTGIPSANLRVYLHRARARLREELRGYEDELLSI